MQYYRQAFLFVRFVAFFSLALPLLASAAGDPVLGKTLFNTPYSGLSCGTSGCHGGYTGANNPNKIINGANNPTLIQSAISGNTGGMGIFSGKFTATDLDNIAAYIATPNASSGTPAASASPTSLAFGNQSINTTSAANAITLSNTGTAALTISGITAPAGFSQSNNCVGSVVAAGTSCIINVTFTPTAVAMYSGNIAITDNATGSPHYVAVSGTGGGVPQASLTPAGLSFNQLAGTTSNVQTVTLSNAGSAALTVNISATANFTQSSTCGASVAASASCSINISFVAPAAAGTYSGTLSVVDNASGSPHTVSLSGTSNAAVPVVALSPLSLAFLSQAVATTSPAKTVTLSNTGTGPLANVSIAAPTGDFAQTNNCGSQVNAGASCTITATFTPTVTGARSGSININDSLGTQTVQLSGTGGTAPAAALSLSGNANFGSQIVGNSSPAQVITLSNGGNAAANISGIAVGTADFIQSNTCGTSLAAAGSCNISVVFKPLAAGARTDALTITDDAAGSPHKLTLSGTGVAATATIAVSPLSLDFGATTTAGQTSAAKPVTVTNTGNSPLTISSISPSAGYTLASNGCTAPVAANGSCAFSVAYAPSAPGASTGTVTISDNATGSPHKVTLTGSAVAATLTAPTSTAGYKVNEVNLTGAANSVVAGPDGNVWFTETAASKIGVISPQGALLNEYATKTANSQPKEIVVGPDKNLWFTEAAGNKIGRVDTSGNMTEFSTGLSANAGLNGIVAGSGVLWFSESLSNKIGRIDTSGTVTEYSTGLTTNAGLAGIAVASDGTIWFAETKANKIGKLDPATNVITEYPVPTAAEDPTAIIMGPDGAFWFSMPNANKIGRIDTSGTITEYAGLSLGSTPAGMVADAKNNLCWFTESATTGRVASIDANGNVTEYTIANVTIQQPASVAIASDGNIWVTEPSVGKMLVMGTVAPAGTTPVGAPAAAPAGSSTNIGGGGGCTVGSGVADGALPILFAIALVFLARRRYGMH